MFKQMRSKAVVAAALSLMLLMSACGTAPVNSNGTDSTSTSSAVISQVTESKEEGTRTVSTVMGDVEVPINPKRIVSESYWVGDIVALGVIPIAIQKFYTGQALYADKLAGTTFLDNWEPETIMSEEPDLIISRHEEDFETLSKIAPTIIIPWDTPDSERLPLLAMALGKEVEDGETVLQTYEILIQEYRKRLEEVGLFDKTITVMHENSDGTIMVELSAWAGGTVYNDLGMTMPEEITKLSNDNPGYGGVSISVEVISQYVGETVLFVDGLYADESTLLESEIWKSIPTVNQGNVARINEDHMFFTDIMTKTAKLNKVVEGLLVIAQ